MIFYSIFNACIIIVYLLIILSYLLGWKKIQNYQKGSTSPSETSVSLIIALRNEGENVPALINSLLNQSIDTAHFEIILIDDHSSDNSFEDCYKMVNGHQHIKLLRLDELSGKKNALRFGINQSKGQLIVTTDADCTHHKDWLITILEFYQKYKPKMIVGPVIMRPNTFFEKIQAIDYYSLMVSGAGAIGSKRPIMCSGANLAFEKESFYQLSDPYNQDMVSGDDVFMLLKIKKKYPDQIFFLNSKDAFVYTKPERTMKEFFIQRKRWTSKSTKYRDIDIIITAMIVFLIHFLLLSNLIMSIFISNLWIIFIWQLMFKSVADYTFLSKTNQFFKIPNLNSHFIITQLFNIVVIPYIAFTGVFSSVKWKGRAYIN